MKDSHEPNIDFHLYKNKKSELPPIIKDKRNSNKTSPKNFPVFCC